jgi:hypothetical protein
MMMIGLARKLLLEQIAAHVEAGGAERLRLRCTIQLDRTARVTGRSTGAVRLS